MNDSEASAERMVVLGRISGLHGVQGWVKVFSDTSPRDNILAYDPWFLKNEAGWEAWKVQAGRSHGKTLIAKLLGCNDRDTARSLMGKTIAVERRQLGAHSAEQGEFFWVDLKGLQVETTTGVALGRIENLFETGSNDVMVIKGDKERLIPWIWKEVVKEVDLKQKRVIVDWDPEF